MIKICDHNLSYTRRLLLPSTGSFTAWQPTQSTRYRLISTFINLNWDIDARLLSSCNVNLSINGAQGTSTRGTGSTFRRFRSSVYTARPLWTEISGMLHQGNSTPLPQCSSILQASDRAYSNRQVLSWLNSCLKCLFIMRLIVVVLNTITQFCYQICDGAILLTANNLMITCFFKVSIRKVSCCSSYQSFNFLNPWKFMDSLNFNRFNKRRLYSTCRTPEFRHISIRHAPEPAHLPGSTRFRSGTLHFGEFRRSPPVRFRAVQRWAEELHRYVLLTTLPIKFKCKRLCCRSKIRHGRSEGGAVVNSASI